MHKERQIRRLLPAEQLFASDSRYLRYHALTFEEINIDDDNNIS